MKKYKIISIGMAAILLFTAALPGTVNATEENAGAKQAATADQSMAEVNNKNEIVYAKLAADGNIDGVYVVNHFEVEQGGSITDYGDYQSVQNLSESEPIEQNEDAVSFRAQEGDFYYQGNLKARDLPWIVEVLPQDLAGKSGEMEIHIRTKQNTAVNSAFYDHYMMQITLTMATDKSSNISAPGATVAYAGNNTILSYTVMPKKNADFRVKADINDFTMSGIELSGIPFSMSVELPDLKGLKKGADELKNGSGGFREGLSKLQKNSSQITGASSQIKEALTTISAALKNSSGGADMGDLAQLPPALKELSQGLKGISGGLNELKNGYALAYTGLDKAMHNIPEDAITQDRIATQFPDANDGQRQLLNQLYTSYMAGQAVKGVYNQVKQAFASVAPTIENVNANLDKISGSLDEISNKMNSSMSGTDVTAQLEQLSKGLTELSGQYSQFDQGLRQYMNGVGKLSDGYKQFDSGLSEFADGVGNLNNRVSDLHDGTARLHEETSKLPEKVQEEVDKLMEDYGVSDFEAISFVSPKNTNTGLVQFVLKCEGIKRTEVETAEPDEVSQNETVWDRFVALFKKD